MRASSLTRTKLVSEEEGEDLQMLDIGTEASKTAIAKSATSKRTNSNSEEEEVHQYVNSQEVHAALSELFHKEKQILGLVYGNRSARKVGSVTAEMFFVRHVLVPPNKYRPEARTGEGEIAGGS